MGLYEDLTAAKAQSDAQGFGAKVGNDLAKVTPYAQTYTTQDNLGTLAPQKLSNSAPASSGSAIDKFLGWAGSVGSEVGSLAAGAATGIFNSAVSSIEAPFKLVGNVAHEFQINSNIDANQKQIDSNSKQLQALAQSYRQGKITNKQYKDQLNELGKSIDSTRKAADANTSAALQNAQDTTSTFIDTSLDVLAVFTAGTSVGLTTIAEGSVKTAADGSVPALINFFGKREVGDTMFNAATKIDSVVQSVINKTNFASTLGGKFANNTIAKITSDTIGNGVASLTSKQIAKNVAVNLLIKKPLIYQTNVDLAASIYTDMQKGDITGAALSTVLTASMALAGGPLGWALEKAGDSNKWLKAAMFSDGNIGKLVEKENLHAATAGQLKVDIIRENAQTNVSRQSFIDALSAHIGTGDASQVYRELINRLDNGDTVSYQAMKAMEEVNMKMAGGNSVKAAQFIADHYNGLDGGAWLRSSSAADVIDGMVNWAQSREAVVADAIKNGMSKTDAQRIVVGRANNSDLGMIADLISAADKSMSLGADASWHDLEKLKNLRTQMFDQAIERYGRTSAWANSETFVTQVKAIIGNHDNPEDMALAITSIKVAKTFEGISNEVKDKIASKGFMAILPEKYTNTPYVKLGESVGKLASAYSASGQSDLFSKAVKPVPVLQAVGSFLTKLGMSPETSANTVQSYFEENFVNIMSKNMTSSDLLGDTTQLDGKQALSKIYGFIRDHNASTGLKTPITDMRQMSVKEISKALGVTKEEAKMVARSINTSMLQIPVAIRGAGDKLLDITSALNPLQAKFSRVQGATRFAYNPFFKWQQAYQTEGLAQLETQGKMVQLPFLNTVNKVLFADKMQENAATIKILEDRNIFGAGFSGSGSSADAFSKIGSNVLKSEKVSLAGVVNIQAERAGMTAEQFIANNESTVVDTLQMITTTNHSGGFTDSPLARTINTVFWPFRYNIKIAGLMAGYIGKMSAPTQVALVTNYMNANTWLSSDQGVAWQTQYSDAIKLFNWLSPTYPLSQVMKLGQDIVDPQDASVGDLGLLGGLPFGMISQMLESNGIITTQAPYIDPKSGDVYPKYIPNSAKAEVNLAIQDFLGSVFSYPGSILGLPSKTGILKGAAKDLVGGNDFTKVDQTGNLSPNQQKYQQQVKQATGKAAQPITAASTSTTPNTSTTIQPNIPTVTPKLKAATPKAKKKSQYIPQPINQ